MTERQIIGYHVRALQRTEWDGRMQQRRVVCPDSGEANFDDKPFLFTREAAFAMRKRWRDYGFSATVHRVTRKVA